MATWQDVLRWGVIGTGKIASDFCTALALVEKSGHKLVAVASRNISNAEKFSSKFGITRHYGNYTELCGDPNVDIVYVGTVTSNHFTSTSMALQAGKHVLCEKPMALSFSQCKEIIQLAKSRNLLFVEGMWSKFLPSYNKIREELINKTVGEATMLYIEFGLKFDWNSKAQIVDKYLGGGTTMGLGCYAIHFANFVFNCERPEKIVATGKIHPSGLDEEAQITLVYSGGRIAQISLSTVCQYTNEATIFGNKGFIKAKQFWCCEEVHCPSGSFTFKFSENTPETNYPKTIGFTYEIEKIKEVLMNHKIAAEEVSHDDSLIASEILDQIFQQLGVDYSKEKSNTSEHRTVNWGVVSTGRIASDFCMAMTNAANKKHKVVAVASRNENDAKRFAEKHGVPRYYGNYLEMAKEEVDIVYIATVNSLHAELSKMFLSSGKAVLCEKPMSISHNNTKEVIECAKKSGTLFVEGFWSRFFPVYKQLKEELQERKIGKIKFVTIQFGTPFKWNLGDRIAKRELGGGVVLDIGCYAIQLACMIFQNKYPSKILANASLHKETGVDQQVAITLSYENGAAVQILLSGTCELANSAVIYGTLGNIVIPAPFWCPQELHTPARDFKFDLPGPKGGYEYVNSGGLIYEIEAVGEAYLNEMTETPEITHNDSLLISAIQAEVLSQIYV